MPARAIGSGTVSFGLVSIPVKVYASSESGSQLSFNMLHGECGSRLKQKMICPKCDVEVPRNQTKRGYEFSKGQYVTLSDEEYKALLEVGKNTIDLVEFVPEDSVNPVFFEKSYYLGPDKGGDRAYKLLAQAMTQTGLLGMAKYAARGKQYLVLIRPQGEQLIMHQLHYQDEVKAMTEVPLADAPHATKAELALAVQIIQQIAKKTFDPSQYEDEVKVRMLDLIQKKIDDGEEIIAVEEEAPQAQIIDLMEALKASLGKKKGDEAGKRAPTKKKPAADKTAARAPAKKKAR